jgi:hypothetical protein
MLLTLFNEERERNAELNNMIYLYTGLSNNASEDISKSTKDMKPIGGYISLRERIRLASQKTIADLEKPDAAANG